MKNLQWQLLNNWTFLRGMRLVLGIIIIYMAVEQKNWPISLLGIFMLYQVITNTGCGAGGSCSIEQKSMRD